MHKRTICTKSDFFPRACIGNCTESKDIVVRLPEVEAEDFSAFVHWVYTDEVKMDLLVTGLPPVTKGPSFRNVAKCWILADALSVPQLCNQLVNIILSNLKEQYVLPSAATLRYIWEKTTTISPLRRLMMDVCAERMTAQRFAKDGTDLPVEIIYDFARRFASCKNRPMEVTAEDLPCRYHFHADGARCTT